MKRSKHSLSHSHLTTFNMGQLIPVGLLEVLPGDTFQHSTSALVRVTPLVAPVMHPVVVRIHHWFVPNRLVWDGWEDFITGGPDGLGGSAGTYPTIQSDPGGFPVGHLADYLGLPTLTGGQIRVNAMPFRGYNMIYNEFYRDQDVQTPVAEDSQSLRHCGWEKDYFTSARPWPQKGPDVSLPLGTVAPVVGTGNFTPTFGGPNTVESELWTAAGAKTVNLNQNAGTLEALKWQTTALQADLTNATAVNINDVRLAFALQRYQEARARFGSRYTEYLRYLGVAPSDARLQLPEYLGGGKQVINFSEVLQTGPGGTEGSPVPGGVGQFAGHGIAGMRTARYRRFFEEHGYVFTIMSVRPRTMYSQGARRTWMRRTKEDYWQRELEQIGQQEIYNAEIYARGDANDQLVFGYQNRYQEYKEHQNLVSGEFQSLLNYWHYSRMFESLPVLNNTFVECDPTKRVYQEQNQDQLLVQVHHSVQARRLVSRSSSSRIL